MAKRVKFPLDMGNDVKVRSIEELKGKYNTEKVTEYFLNGKLLTWLEDRYYDEEAEQVRELSEQTHDNLAAKLAEIFGVEITESVDIEMLEIRRKKLEKLREITSEDEILDNVDHVAFSQEELGDLLDKEAHVIYLYGESFRIPLSVKNVRYVGINNPVVTISGNSEINLGENNIVIENCEFSNETISRIVKNDDKNNEMTINQNSGQNVFKPIHDTLACLKVIGNVTSFYLNKYEDKLNTYEDELKRRKPL